MPKNDEIHRIGFRTSGTWSIADLEAFSAGLGAMYDAALTVKLKRAMVAQGLKHAQRSLRDFDLKTRLFRYPCSYLIHSPSFDGLPPELLERVYVELGEILLAEPGSDAHPRLSRADRRAILEILTATKAVDYPRISLTQRQAIREILTDTAPDLPAYWKESK